MLVKNMGKLFQGARIGISSLIEWFHAWWNASVHQWCFHVGQASSCSSALPLTKQTLHFNSCVSLGSTYLVDQNPYVRRVMCWRSQTSAMLHTALHQDAPGWWISRLYGKADFPTKSICCLHVPAIVSPCRLRCVPLCFSPTSFSCYDCHVLEGEVQCDLMSPGKQTNRLTHR